MSKWQQKAKQAYPSCKAVLPSGFLRDGDSLMITTDEKNPRVIVITGKDLDTVRMSVMTGPEIAAGIKARHRLKNS